MINKKEDGGLSGASEDLLQPGDQNLDENNLIDSSTNNQLSVGTFGGGRSILTKLQNYGFDSNGYEHGKIDRREWDEYDRLIEGPFSLYDKNLDDRRAEGQGFGEKAVNAIGKFAIKTPVHVLGSTFGIVDGLGEVVSDVYTNGFASSNWNQFFNNDFQRSLDDFNESLDNKLPHYYSSQERDLNFGQSVFGKGAANFWTNDFSQGLSFVAGAVLSEYATAGMAKFLLPAKAANKLKGIAAIRATTYGQKAINANKNLQKINRAERIYDGLTTGRRLLTGAFYESGVEARHNYDATLDRLNELHLENIGTPPTAEDQARMKDVAIKVSNGVFAGNAALVGYSNLLMFRRIFGSGLTKNKNFANKIIKDPITGKMRAAHKDWGKFRSALEKYGYVAYRPFYEGVVEEGGQKTLDIAGQYAAEDMYLDEKSPAQLDAIREILEHTHDGMAEAYGSAEGQKEIFLGALLAAIGLPSFIGKNEKGETTFKPGYGKTGGLKDFFNQYAEGKKEVEDLVTYMNENPEALAGIRYNFDMLNGIKIADDKRDYADASNNDFAYKNADHDGFFSFVHSRLKGGYFGDVMDSLDDIGNMDLDSFETMFKYEDQTESMSKKERETFLSERKNTVITTHKARANKIKEIYDSLDNTKINDSAKKMIAQALSSTSDLDAREQKLISEVEETGGFSLTAIVDKEESDKQANDNIFTMLKNFTMKSIGMKAKSIMENSETGQEIKREIGIKEFTAPGHPEIVFKRLANKIIELEKKRDAALNDENAESYVELDDKIKILKDELSELVLSINQGLNPEISEEEQQILDQYKKKDPAGYELNKEEIIKKLQDLRKIRAKRHQMLNLVQQLIDPDAANDKIQSLEQLVQDTLSEEERKKLPPAEQALLRKYKGKIIEFEYTNSKGETKTNRVYVKDGSEKGLVKIPNDETFRLLQRQKVLLDKKIKTPDDLAELALIKEELVKSEHVVKHDTFNFGFLEKAKNITILTEQELLLKQLQVVTNVLQDGLAENLAASLQAIAASKEKVVSLAQQIKDIKIAVQQAKVNKRGALYVNLNAIGRKGAFSLESALNILNELKTEEGAYEQQIQDYTQYLNMLQDNSLRIQVIHTALTNPETISKLLDKSASPTDIFEFINEALGLTSLEEFYKNLGEKGFFDTNELTAIAGQKNKDGGYDVDNQLLQELLDLAGSNITEDYLNLMNSDLVAFKDELKLLSQHRQDVERMLNKMVNPITKQVVFFPEEGLTEDDLTYLSYQLKMIDTDIETLQGIINMLEAEAEQNFRDASNSDLIQERVNAQQAEQSIANSLNEYMQWLQSLENEETEEINQDPELADELPPRDFSPSFTDVGFNRTAGNHALSLKIQNKYQSMLDNNQELTEAEKLQFEHAKAQSRFFRHSYDILDYSKTTGAKLQIVTRYNIRSEWKDKFVFYDILKAQKSGKPNDSSNYQYVDGLTNYSSQVEQDPNMVQEKDGTWRSRIGDKQVPVKTEEFKVTTTDGEVIIFKARTALDGSVTWTKKAEGSDIFQPADIGMIGATSAREGLDVFEKAGDTVEVGEVGDYKGVMNPKMWDKLTQEQKERVDPVRAKETAPTTDKDETFEDIKLLLVDAQGAPILVDGEFAYTSMTTSALYREDGVFKGQESVDMVNGVVKEEIIKFQEAFIKQRNSLLADNTEKFFYITKKSRGLAINRNILSEEEELLNLETGLGKLRIKENKKIKIAKEEDLKDISISIAITQKGDKSNSKVDLFGFRVAPGTVYIGSGNYGALKTNNLIQVVRSNLSENRVNSLYNLSRYFATKSTGEGIGIEGKGFIALIKDQIRYGKSKSGVVSPFDIYLQGDSIVFGDKKQVIAFEQLKNPAKWETINNEYKDFLRTLRFNIDAARLNPDIKARADALKAFNLLKGTKNEKKFVDPAYEKFKEVIINDDLSTTTIEWDNYTHYILSGENGREVEDVPGLFRLPSASESINVKQATIPQFLNVYLLHSEDAVSLPALSVEEEVIIEATPPYETPEETPEETPNTQGELEDAKEGVKNKTHKIVVYPVTLDDGSIVKVEEIVKIEEESTSSIIPIKVEGTDTKVDSSEVSLNKQSSLGSVVSSWLQTKEGSLNNQTAEESASKFALIYNRKNPVTAGDNRSIAQIIEDNKKLTLGQRKDNAGQVGVDLFNTIAQGMKVRETILNEIKSQVALGFTNMNEGIEPFFLATMAEAPSDVDLDSQLNWFNANMPKDSKGNPLVSLDIIQGLIDNKGYGKFTKDGNILLSDLMDVPGIVYHESWHAVTRRFISPEQRFALYDEVRGIRGETQTYKGVTKKMSELTDKEADEWLAEEFREYVLAGGNYKVGDRVEKSLMDRIFDKIFSLLNFFINNKSQAQLLMSQLNSGYFSNPTTNITVYDSNTEAYYEATKLTATMRNNAMQGMTVILFNKNIFNLSDFASSNTKVQEQLTAAIRNAYGDTNTRGTVYSQMQAYINNAIKIASPTNKIKLQKTQLAIRDNWEQLKSEHLQYIKRFTVEIDSEIDEEDEKTREQFQKPQNEIDPSIYLPKAVRILLGTLPKHTENKTAIVNSSGLPSLVDFGNIINFMYKEFANVSPNEVLALLKSPYLQNKRPEIKTLIKRLGIESDDIQDLSTNKMKMLIQTMMHFNQSNNKFYTQIMSDTGSRMLVDSNKNKVEDKVKELWKQTFKNNIQTIKGLGKEKDGKLILNADAKIKIGERESDKKTFAEWANFGKRTPEQSLIILGQLGITFSNKNEFIAKYNEDDTFRRSITFIIKEATTTALSDMFESNEQGNLKKLIELEVLYNPLIVNNQHRSPEGKTVHGVNLKNYLDVLVSDLTTVTSNGYRIANTDYIEGLLKYDNLKNSIYLNSMLLAPQNTLEVVILEGMRHEFSKGKSLSKGSPSDIGVMLVNAVLSEGIIPILRTADKKTEYGLKFKTPNLNLNLDTMLIRLQGYLADEIRAASIFNSQRKSKLHRVAQLKDKGGNLRYFEKIVPSLDRSAYGKTLTENKIKELVSSPKVVNDLQQFLQNEIAKTKTVLTNYNIALDGIDSNLLLTAQNIASQTGKYPLDVIAEQFVYEYITGVNEQGKLLLGDFALYSDLFKRTAGLSGTKAYPTSNPSILNWMNEKMPNLFSNKEHSNSLQVVHRAAVKTEAPYLNQYIEALEASGASQAILQNVSDVYSNMEEFDGGGFITLDAYRSLMYRIGKWTDSQEAFYQNLAAPGYVLKAEDIAIIPPIKPQLFGPFIVDNLRLMTFHKFALFPIIPGITTNTAFDTINQDMVNNNIDYMIFDSAAKVGGITANLQGYDPFYEEAPEGYNKYKPMSLDNTNTPLGLQELSFSDLGIQLETAPKTSEYVREGSQFRSLLLVNAYNQGKLAEGYEDFEGAIDKYHEINNELIEKDFKNLLEKLKLVKQKDGRYKLSSKDAKAFQEALEREFKKRDNPLHTIDSIKKLFQSDTKFIEQLFEKDKIERLFYSLVTNNVIKRKMKGGQFVLQASTGFESTFKAIKQGDFERAASLGVDLHESQLKPLKFYRKADPNNLNSETLAMQVYLPSRFKNMLGTTIEDINDRRISPEILQLIGFRIPTEGLNSIDFIEVVGFLPKSFGDTVIVPSEIVGKAGSDYDIDKLTIYFPHTEIGEDGVIRRVAYDSNKTVQEQSKEALQNELQNISKAILSHPVSFEQLISPVGAYQLKDLALKVALKRNPENFNPDGTKIKLPLSETLSLENMLKTSYRMFSGLGGIGIVATSSTQHAKGQRAGVNWNFADHPDIVFNFEGQGFGLSRVYDVNNKNKISSTIGQYVTGYVDVTKEDFIFDINGGIEYAPIHMLLVRSGVPLESVVYFMSQPIIDDYVQMKEKFQPMYERFPIKTNQTIVDELVLKYKTDVKSIPVTFSENNLFDMIGSTSLSPMQKAAQIKILEDFLRYEKLAKDLMLLKDASSFDTAELSGSIDIRYAKQALSRLQQTGKFINLDELLLGNVEGASTVASYVKLMSEVDGLFADFKLGEYILDAKTFVDGKLFEATDPELKFYKDNVIYKMSKFENFLASTVIQNTTWEYEKLSDRASDLFKGSNSLPRRISALKTDPAYRDNLLIQELLPIFQVYTENSPEQTVDTMKLFSKGLQPYDIDILADAFMEIKEINPELAKDLIIFSALQSGLNYSPNSFFQVIPGVEVLDVMAKYFKQNNHINRTSNLIKNDNMDELWTDFHQNYTDNSQIVPNVYRKTIENFYKLKRNDEFVSVTSKTGEVQVGSITKNVYATNLYKRFGKTEDGKTNYKQILKKGVPFHLIEATGPNTLSIVNNNYSIKKINSDSEQKSPEVTTSMFTVHRNIDGEITKVLSNKKC